MTTQLDECALCDQQVAHQHHLTGRGVDHLYLDPTLTVGLCQPHHALLHSQLAACDLEQPLTATTPFERVARRLARVATFLGRLFEITGCRWLGALATSIVDWTRDLGNGVVALDAWDPRWRSAFG